MKRLFSCMFLVAAVISLATNAAAATFNLTAGPTPGSPQAGLAPAGAPNDFLGPSNLFPLLPTLSGYYGTTVNYSVVGLGASVTIDFFGGEAAFNDQFLYNSGGGFVLPPGFDHSGVPTRVIAPSLGAPLATFTAGLSGSGVLPFEFMVNGVAGGATGGPLNGGNPLNIPGLPPNFFAACAPLAASGATPTSCETLWLFLDDNGANKDDDHDDYVVRLTVSDGESTTQVPETHPLALLSSGLLGLGIVWRKFQN